jgi:hypothetical protein
MPLDAGLKQHYDQTNPLFTLYDLTPESNAG